MTGQLDEAAESMDILTATFISFSSHGDIIGI